MAHTRKLMMALAVFAGLTASAAANEFPRSTIRIVVPFPAGGPTDVLARHIGQGIAEELKTSVIIDNRPGAKRADRHRGDPGLQPHASGDQHHDVREDSVRLEKDFRSVALGATVPNALVMNAKLPAKSLAEFIALAKKEPDRMSYGAFGGTNQLAGEMFKYIAKWRYVAAKTKIEPQ